MIPLPHNLWGKGQVRGACYQSRRSVHRGTRGERDAGLGEAGDGTH